MNSTANTRHHRPLGWVLLCVALAAFALNHLEATPFLNLTLSVGLSATFFGLLFILEDKLMFGFHESLSIFGFGFFIGTFIRSLPIF